ncbi:MAG: nucleotidyltransferase domain-containing protein [Patescibacteria group bacterium]
MSKNQVKKIVRQYADKLKIENYPYSAVYLFGSHVCGNAHQWSDIDVAVISNKLRRNWWENEIRLSKLSLGIDYRIEPHGFTPEDFKDACDPMVQEIKKTGIRIV